MEIFKNIIDQISLIKASLKNFKRAKKCWNNNISTQRCLKQIKTDNHKRNGRKHIGEITVLPIMSLTPYYTEVISLSVSSVQPDLKKGKTTRVEGDGTRENHYWPQSREVRTVSKFTLEFTLVFKTTLLSTTRFSCGTANWPNWKQRENVEI